jgi:hypothetical protein
MVLGMTRMILRRYIERIALGSLPLLGGLGCGAREPLSAIDMHTTPPVEDLAAPDLACPASGPPCYWYTYVAGAVPNLNISYWYGPDGGSSDPCEPCGFETLANTTCGQCQVVQNSCGTAYFCAIFDCNPLCNSSGRRPSGLQLPSLATTRVPGDVFARMAQLEAASVPAFAQLERELNAHGAPERLLSGARRALIDEERHAQMMGDLARRVGSRLQLAEVSRMELRPLVDVAIENAVEGCVRETVGAVAAWKTSLATNDSMAARVLTVIAADEQRHANLAWAVDRWVMTRLESNERRAVEIARANAVRDLLVT